MRPLTLPRAEPSGACPSSTPWFGNKYLAQEHLGDTENHVQKTASSCFPSQSLNIRGIRQIELSSLDQWGLPCCLGFHPDFKVIQVAAHKVPDGRHYDSLLLLWLSLSHGWRKDTHTSHLIQTWSVKISSALPVTTDSKQRDAGDCFRDL